GIDSSILSDIAVDRGRCDCRWSIGHCRGCGRGVSGMESGATGSDRGIGSGIEPLPIANCRLPIGNPPLKSVRLFTGAYTSPNRQSAIKLDANITLWHLL